MEGEEPSRRGEADQGEDFEEIEGKAALAGTPEASEAPNLAPSNQPLVSQAEQSFLKMMKQMTQFIGQLTQAVYPRDTSRAPAFNTPSMKEPYSFDGTKAYQLRGSGKGIEPYLSNISNEDPSYLLNDWQLFETQLFTLFSDSNEVRKAEQELDNLRMKESGQVYLFEWDFFIIDSPKGEELILGYDFLYHFNPIIDWKSGFITYDSSHKDCSGINSSTSNDFATAVNSVALVGEIKTPSLPPSVHIPSIIPSQSLLPSKD
ncbi:hypothetical protein O181_005879 [Austropuccinia psidii MF-1]|uniref:Uncharacterized protein n=1 Tax=Austropuccinia psidii MF-1 TaxID=1389203 RepID=A0A9Q3GGA9_9BASI|nr:hypothetical protein [Austropuccinia psidii MF-1]